jgi:hypothetical protein
MPGFSQLINKNRIDRNTEILRLTTSDLFGLNFWRQNRLSLSQEAAVLNGRFFDMCPPRPLSNPTLIKNILDFGLLRWNTIKSML